VTARRTGQRASRAPTSPPTPHPTRLVPVQLDKQRHLRFTLGAMRRILEEKGDGFLDLGNSSSISENLERVSYLIWQGLLWEDRDLKQDEVDEMVDFGDFDALTDAILTALGVAGRKAKAAPRVADDDEDGEREEDDGVRPALEALDEMAASRPTA
jgi:hypothetical protein